MNWRYFEFCRGSAFRFFGRRRIGAMADHRHHGEGEHHQGNVAMPPMPGSAYAAVSFKWLTARRFMVDERVIKVPGIRRVGGSDRALRSPGSLSISMAVCAISRTGCRMVVNP